MSDLITATVTLANSEQYCPHHTELSGRIGRLLTQTEAELCSSNHYMLEDLETMSKTLEVLFKQVDVLNARIALYQVASHHYPD
jgi:hypothetical protein